MEPGALDIIFVADARFPGGTSTALVNEIRAAHSAGFTAGLLHVAGPVLKRAHPFHPQIRALIESKAIQLLDPLRDANCHMVIVHHPMLFPRPLRHTIGLNAQACVLVAHHPARDAAGAEQYDIRQQCDAIERSLGLKPLVAPVGPNVRASLADAKVLLTKSDWHNLVDPNQWWRKFRPFGDPIVIGRHARPDPLKWPDSRRDTLNAWPDDPAYRIEILGGGAFLKELLGGWPANWRVRDFGSCDVRAFLHSLDAFVYFHSSRWVEAFGYSVLEALACGLPVILPESFRPLFEDGALYTMPQGVTQCLGLLAADQRMQRRQRESALAVVRRRFAITQFAPRLKDQFGLTARRGRLVTVPRVMAAVPRKPRIALLMSSNGVGLGHLTRLMAIARKLPSDIRPVFFTLSRAARLAVGAGYLVEHTSFHRYIATTPERWNTVLARELSLALDFYDPEVLVFDGNVPYAGLLLALQSRTQVRKLWIRRGFWRADEGGILKRAKHFDAIVEPNDLAQERDDGPTARLRNTILTVDPVLMIDPTERLSRWAARRKLGIGLGQRAVMLQLGSGNNFDFSEKRHRILSRLLADPSVVVIELCSPIADALEEPKPLGARHRQLRLYPAYRFSRAFSAAIVAAGYNSFHECLYGAIPTLFVANLAGEMDRQDLRALHASSKEWGIDGTNASGIALDQLVDRLMDAHEQHRMRRNLSELSLPRGAAQIAQLIEEFAFSAHLRAAE